MPCPACVNAARPVTRGPYVVAPGNPAIAELCYATEPDGVVWQDPKVIWANRALPFYGPARALPARCWRFAAQRGARVLCAIVGHRWRPEWYWHHEDGWERQTRLCRRGCGAVQIRRPVDRYSQKRKRWEPVIEARP